MYYALSRGVERLSKAPELLPQFRATPRFFMQHQNIVKNSRQKTGMQARKKRSSSVLCRGQWGLLFCICNSSE